MKKIVLTGAAGRLGSYLREPLSKMADVLISSDIAPDIGKLYPGESYVQAELANYDAIHALMKDADMVVHFGAHPDEAPFAQLLGPNFVGAYNIWEAAYQNGVRRVVYASSIHAVGMISSAPMCRIVLIHFMVWPNVLLKIWRACIGISGRLKLCVCASSPVRK
jgi:uronate dehydrogenase